MKMKKFFSSFTLGQEIKKSEKHQVKLIVPRNITINEQVEKTKVQFDNQLLVVN